MKKGDLVECIVNTFRRLTIGREYLVLKVRNSWIHIFNDDGQEVAYKITHFKLAENANGWIDRNFIKLVEEQEGKWKIIKPFSLLDIYKIGNSQCFRTQFEKLMKERKGIYIDYQFKEFHQLKKSKVLMYNLYWLEENGFIEKTNNFKPFTLKLNIQTAEELKAIHTELNQDNYAVTDKAHREAIGSLYYQVEAEMYRIEDE